MNDKERQDPLIEAFTGLARQQPSPAFTDEVLAALEDRAHGRPGRSRHAAWLIATTLVLASLLAVGYGYRRQQAAERAYREQVEELKSRYQELLHEVATVRREAEAPDTRWYLGGDEQVDLVLDLGQYPGYPEGGRDRQAVRPASWEH